MNSGEIPVFGERLAGKDYIRRPGAYAVILDAVGAVAVVAWRGHFYLPGGGIERGETAEEALIREVAEETGWGVEILQDLGAADEHFEHWDGGCWTKAGRFFLARVSGEAPIARDPDHAVLWLRLADALPAMAHPSQAWAIERGLAAGERPDGPASSSRVVPCESLPADFLAELTLQERAYLSYEDPIAQSGFKAGPHRWRAEREPILAAVTRGGTLLDVGCANGYLAMSLQGWAAERGLDLVPYGVDIGPDLVAAAGRRHPDHADHFFVGNAWDWDPPFAFDYVYALYDCVPLAHLGALAGRLLAKAVKPGGRLIVGAYGSRSRGLEPLDIGGTLRRLGYAVAGEAIGGDPVVTRFAWIDRPWASLGPT